MKPTYWVPKFLAAAFVCLLLNATSGLAEDTSPRASYFSLDSGGAYHISGYGAWLVSMNLDVAKIYVTHQLRDTETPYGPYDLTAEEHATLIQLIEDADFFTLPSSTRFGIPDEIMMQFTVAGRSENPGPHVVRPWFWNGDVRDDLPKVKALIDNLRDILTKYTGQVVVLL